MTMKTKLGLATVMVMTGSHAFAQTTAAPPAPGAQVEDKRENQKQPPIPGANSFTEAQAKERIQKAGFADVKDLKKDDAGVWRGQAVKDGGAVGVALDYQGNVVQSQP